MLLHREARSFISAPNVKLPTGNMRRFRNAVGPRIRKLRTQKNLSQEAFASKLQLAGLDLDRISVAKIEMQIRSVFDFELAVIADVLEVTTDDLRIPRVQLKGILPALIAGKK
jgi:transcriptional regulator with XRE-family HTH domain